MLFGALVAAGLVDELFLTLSPLLAGPAAPAAALTARGRRAAARPDVRRDAADAAARRLAPVPALQLPIDFYPRRIRAAMEVTHVH